LETDMTEEDITDACLGWILAGESSTHSPLAVFMMQAETPLLKP